MIDLLAALIQQQFILLYLIPFVLLLKIVLFSRKRTHSWKLSHFFYFCEEQIITCRSSSVEAAKKTQNILSLIILILAGVQASLLIVISW